MASYLLNDAGVTRPLSLGRKLGEGAAGVVCSLPSLSGKAAKIYKSIKEAAEYEEKIGLMLTSRPNLPDICVGGVECRQIAWPEARILDHTGRFAGFVMPEIDFAQSRPLESILQKNSRRADNIDERYELRIVLAANLASVFAELHRVGHYMIDMKPDNLRFYPKQGYLAVVDADGFSIKGPNKRLPSHQFTDNYIAPEGRGRRPETMAVDQDLFALAVITFQLLNNGLHPYSGVVKPGGGLPSELQPRIYANLYAYGLAGHKAIKPAPSTVHTSFDDRTRALFDRAFLGGGGRPAAHEWREHFQSLLKGRKLITCVSNPKDHVHFGRGCGLCDYESRLKAARKATARRQQAQSLQTPRRNSAKHSSPTQTPIAPAAVIHTTSASAGVAVTNPPIWPKLVGGAFGLWLLGSIVSCISNSVGTSPQTPLGQQGVGSTQTSSVQSFSSPQFYVIASSPGVMRVNVRSGPGGGYSQVAQLSVGDRVTGSGFTTGTDGATWIAVTLPGGTAGFIAERLLSPAAQQPPSSEQPSFSCTGNLNYVESTICGDASLAVKDREVADLYQRVLRTASGSGARDTQRGWLEARDRCGGSGDIPACLHSEYDTRLVALRDWLSASTSDQSAGQTLPSRASSQEPLDVWRTEARQSGRTGRQENLTPTPTIVCILPSAREIRMSEQQCREMSGSIYQ